MHVRPQIVYKYKSISTQTDFNRVVDIIKSNHIYLPKPSMLNDPWKQMPYKCIWIVWGLDILLIAEKYTYYRRVAK